MITEKFTLNEILDYNFETGKIFVEFKIPFAHYLKFELGVLCRKKSIRLDLILSALNQFPEEPKKDFFNFPIKLLIEKILNEFHDYSRKRLALAEKNVHKLYDNLKPIYPKIKDIYENFIEFKEEFESHLLKEEQAIFPEIQNIDNLLQEKKIIKKPNSLEIPIENMESEHLDQELHFQRILESADEFLKLDQNLLEAKNYFSELNLFYLNLNYHVYIENEMLFKKAKRIENSFYFEV